MSNGILPSITNGGTLAISGASNSYVPPAPFTMTCGATALPNDCTAKFDPAQINAIVSELLCLAAAFNPSGVWTCSSLCNLGTNFNAFLTGTGPGTLGAYVSALMSPSIGAGNLLTLGADGKLFLDAQGIANGLCADAAARNTLVACIDYATIADFDVSNGVETSTLPLNVQSIAPLLRYDTANSIYALGIGAASGATGSNVFAEGVSAAANNTGSNVTASGYAAANGNSGSSISASGWYAARDNTGNWVSADGYYAAYQNTGSFISASGNQAAYRNSGDNVSADGYYAARQNTGDNVSASGWAAAFLNTGNIVSAAGWNAATQNSGNNVDAFGYYAGFQNTFSNVTLLGKFSAATANNQAVLGGPTQTPVGYAPFATISDARDKLIDDGYDQSQRGLPLLMALTPRAYRLNPRARYFDREVITIEPGEGEEPGGPTQQLVVTPVPNDGSRADPNRSFAFIAQDVRDAAIALGLQPADVGVIDTADSGGDGTLLFSPERLVGDIVLAIKSMQASHAAEVSDLTARLVAVEAELANSLAALEQRLAEVGA